MKDYRRSCQPSIENIHHFKTWKFCTFFHFCGSFLTSWILIRIRNLNPDPDPATQINAEPLPWPLHWVSYLISEITSVVVLWIVDPDRNPHGYGTHWFWSAGSGPWRAKIDPQNNFMFCTAAGCSLLKAECFTCSLDILHGGLWICELQFFFIKTKFVPAYYFFSFKFYNFCLPNPVSGSLIWIETNADLQHYRIP